MKTYYKRKAKWIYTGIVIIAMAIFVLSKNSTYTNKTISDSTTHSSVEFLGLPQEVKDGKSDAFLIKIWKEGQTPHYILNDCGHYKTEDELIEKLVEKCQDNKNKEGRVVLDAVVISHCHNDHMGALTTLLNSDEVEVLSLFYTNVGAQWDKKDQGKKRKCVKELVKENAADTLCFEVSSLEEVSKSQAENIADLFNGYYDDENILSANFYGDGKKHNKIELILGNETFTMYGPKSKLEGSIGCENRYDAAANDCSTITTLRGELNAAFLGDTRYRGLKNYVETYGGEFENIRWDVVKFGHHGLRATEIKDRASLDKETELYSTYFPANTYIFTADMDNYKAESDADKYELAADNLEYIKQGLREKIKDVNLVEMTKMDDILFK